MISGQDKKDYIIDNEIHHQNIIRYYQKGCRKVFSGNVVLNESHKIMPEKIEKSLKSQASKKGMSKERTAAYVYGTLRKTGWKPKHKGKSKK